LRSSQRTFISSPIAQLCPQFAGPFTNAWKVIMDRKHSASFDPETVVLLRETLDDASDRLHPEQRAKTSRTLLAGGILKSAAKGERNPERLRQAAALTAVAA
jgi:hypothetical protein